MSGIRDVHIVLDGRGGGYNLLGTCIWNNIDPFDSELYPDASEEKALLFLVLPTKYFRWYIYTNITGKLYLTLGLVLSHTLCCSVFVVIITILHDYIYGNFGQKHIGCIPYYIQ